MNVRILLDRVVPELLQTLTAAKETNVLFGQTVLAERAGTSLAWEENTAGTGPSFATAGAVMVGAAGKVFGVIADARAVEMQRDGTLRTTEHVGTTSTFAASLAKILMGIVLDCLLTTGAGRDLLALEFLVED